MIGLHSIPKERPSEPTFSERFQTIIKNFKHSFPRYTAAAEVGNLGIVNRIGFVSRGLDATDRPWIQAGDIYWFEESNLQGWERDTFSDIEDFDASKIRFIYVT